MNRQDAKAAKANNDLIAIGLCILVLFLAGVVTLLALRSLDCPLGALGVLAVNPPLKGSLLA
jgi:hypothetical protein